MYWRIGILASVVALAGVLPACDVAVVAERPGPVVAEEPAPYYVDEGAVYNGAVVVEPGDINDYVYSGGRYYYWHPGLRTWVRVNHGADWRPPHDAHVYRHWNEHPMYHR